MSSRDWRRRERSRDRDQYSRREKSPRARDSRRERARSRSRSPRRSYREAGRERDRSRERDRERDRDNTRRERSRSREDHRGQSSNHKDRNHEESRPNGYQGSRRAKEDSNGSRDLQQETLGLKDGPKLAVQQQQDTAKPAHNDAAPPQPQPPARLNLDPEPDLPEEGEAEEDYMDATNPDDEAMAAMMGFGGFGTTKDKEVSGNQTGGVFVKKQRTWRQYMNRRGGFNRPLDKIK